MSATLPFQPLTAAALLAQPDNETPWIIDPLLARGDLAMLSSPPKVGKSTFSTALVLAVAQGRPFLDCEIRKPGGVLILALEESRRNVRRRLLHFGMRSNDPIYIWAGPLNPDRLPEVAAFLAEHPEIVLVVLDTLSRYWIGKLDEENSNTQVARVTEPLLRLARDQHVCILLLHHDRKNSEGGSSPNNIRGAGDLLAVVDQAIQIEKRGKGARRALHITGRYQDESPSDLMIELVGNEYRVIADTNTTKTWAALIEDRGKTVQELEDETSQGRYKINADLKALGDKVRAEGHGTRGDRKRYRRRTPDDVGVAA